jgi:phosphotransferase system enzyme I (PtsI)
MKRPLAGERVFDGLGVAPGIAIGIVHRHEPGQVSVPEYRIAANRIDAEKARFAAAAADAGRQVEDLLTKAKRLPTAAAEEMGYLLEAYTQMLKGSRLVRGVERRITDVRLNAEAAVQKEIAEIVEGLASVDDTYIAARAADIREVGQRLLRALNKTPWRPFTQVPKNAVIVAEELSPADTALLDPSLVAGVAAEMGGTEGHTAIMARSLGLPAVLGVPGLMSVANEGDSVIVDGSLGQVVLNPTHETLALYRSLRTQFLHRRKQLQGLRKLPAVTQDGFNILLHANLELPAEVDSVLSSGASGIGLLRSEFLFMNRQDLPDEEEQYQALRDIVLAMDGRPVTVRTLDAGGEKLPGLSPPGENPALGLRAIRLSLSHRHLLEAQISACIRAAAHGPVRLLLPMITTVDEIEAVRETMVRMNRRLRRRRIPLPEELPPLGVMIEVPGAALSADALARHSDFFSIGTNDLTMYTLAIDRADEQVAHLYNPLHPAVLRLIQFACEAALRARIPVSVCGEMAGDPRYTPLLLGLGIRELSMASINLPRVKQCIRGLNLMEAIRRARTIMDQHDAGRIAALLDEFNSRIDPSV